MIDIYGLNKGKKKSPEHVEKIRLSKICKTHSEETKLKNSLAHSGDKHWAFGKSLSEEHKSKMRKAKEKISKAVVEIFDDGSYTEYVSIRDTVRCTGMPKTTIMTRCTKNETEVKLYNDNRNSYFCYKNNINKHGSTKTTTKF
jgi:DNA invertase Pin-like site-specific DNA recombinase